MKKKQAATPPGLFARAKARDGAPVDREAIRRALEEDAPKGDVTSRLTIPSSARAKALLLAKQDITAAGMAVFASVFREVDPGVKITLNVRDGAAVHKGETMAQVTGSARSILLAERVALNYLTRLCSIATLTAGYVGAVKGTGAAILDTRKTTPGLRDLEKYAVRIGGGMNHRRDLSSMALIKENHIAVAGGVGEAIGRVKSGLAPGDIFEIEVTNLDELREALAAGATHIMLDNISPAMMKKAVTLAAGKARLEASGNMTIPKARQAAQAGVDFISVGALTHSATAVDLSLIVKVGKR